MDKNIQSASTDEGAGGLYFTTFSTRISQPGKIAHFHSCSVDIRLHDARHTYTTLLQEKNVRPIDAMGRTGLTDMRTLIHYSHPKLGIIHEGQFEFMQDA